MSFINPEKVPVTVYKWDDEDAPRLDRSPNCVATIFKACLVTGYGNKQGAGWTMPYEDNEAGVKVLRPAMSPEQDFYLRLSNDTGQEMTAQVYLNMTDVNTGELKLQCTTPFKYGYGKNSGKWILIASGRSFWFLFEQIYQGEKMNKSGGYFFCGDTAKNPIGNKAIVLKHSGGRWSDGAGYDVLSTNNDGSTFTYMLDEKQQISSSVVLESFFSSKTNKTDVVLFAPIYAYSNKQFYPLPAIYSNSAGAIKNNFEMHNDKMVFALSSYQEETNFYFDIEYWTY